jgi:hypothetical protein
MDGHWLNLVTLVFAARFRQVPSQAGGRNALSFDLPLTSPTGRFERSFASWRNLVFGGLQAAANAAIVRQASAHLRDIFLASCRNRPRLRNANRARSNEEERRRHHDSLHSRTPCPIDAKKDTLRRPLGFDFDQKE